MIQRQYRQSPSTWLPGIFACGVIWRTDCERTVAASVSCVRERCRCVREGCRESRPYVAWACAAGRPSVNFRQPFVASPRLSLNVVPEHYDHADCMSPVEPQQRCTLHGLRSRISSLRRPPDFARASGGSRVSFNRCCAVSTRARNIPLKGLILTGSQNHGGSKAQQTLFVGRVIPALFHGIISTPPTQQVHHERVNQTEKSCKNAYSLHCYRDRL